MINRRPTSCRENLITHLEKEKEATTEASSSSASSQLSSSSTNKPLLIVNLSTEDRKDDDYYHDAKRKTNKKRRKPISTLIVHFLQRNILKKHRVVVIIIVLGTALLYFQIEIFSTNDSTDKEYFNHRKDSISVGSRDSSTNSAEVQKTTTDTTALSYDIENFDWSKLDDCTQVMSDLRKTIQPHLDERRSAASWNTKPIWAPSYPNSIEDPIMKRLITSITGLSAGAKSFYASQRRRGLRHCLDGGKTETVLCLNIHPMVNMNGGPQAKGNAFDQNNLVYLLRNPALAIPAFLNMKAIKYHGMKGQIPIDSWRQQRDEHLFHDNTNEGTEEAAESLWDGWVTQLTTWLDMREYKPTTFLIYEHLMNPLKGPIVIQHFSSVLHRAGFPSILHLSSSQSSNNATNSGTIVDSSSSAVNLQMTTNSIQLQHQAECLWLEAVGGRNGVEIFYAQKGYDFDEYVPGYTLEQKQKLIQGLQNLIDQYSTVDAVNDNSGVKHMCHTLREYQRTVAHDIPDDTIIWNNVTTANKKNIV